MSPILSAPAPQTPPPVATLLPGTAQAVGRGHGLLTRVEPVAPIGPRQPRTRDHRIAGEDRLGHFGIAAGPAAAGGPSSFHGRRLPGAPTPGEVPAAGSIRFLAQVIGQQAGGQTALSEHRDGFTLGSQAYRKAGADPALYSETPTLVRFAA